MNWERSRGLRAHGIGRNYVVQKHCDGAVLQTWLPEMQSTREVFPTVMEAIEAAERDYASCVSLTGIVSERYDSGAVYQTAFNYIWANPKLWAPNKYGDEPQPPQQVGRDSWSFAQFVAAFAAWLASLSGPRATRGREKRRRLRSDAEPSFLTLREFPVGSTTQEVQSE